jgi:predicted 2-oxoglutarate/Fe(II)-dependent dioxygenase YbiX
MYSILDYIIVVPKAVPDSLCNAIVNEYKDSTEWEIGYINNKVREDIRNCQNIPISRPAIMQVNLEHRTALDNQLFHIAGKVINDYTQKFGTFIIEKDEGYTLLRYETGQFIKSHIDTSAAGETGLNNRKVSCSFALNDEYTGGEFSFFNGEHTLKLDKGSILLFPSNFVYPHEILEVKSGTRYSIITWFN